MKSPAVIRISCSPARYVIAPWSRNQASASRVCTCSGLAWPGGWVTTEAPSRPAVSSAPTRRSNSIPMDQVAGPVPAARLTTTSVADPDVPVDRLVMTAPKFEPIILRMNLRLYEPCALSSRFRQLDRPTTSVLQCFCSSEANSDKIYGGLDVHHQPDSLDRAYGDAADIRG